MRTRKPFCMSQKQTFDRFVLFPTPFTPTKVILYGCRCWDAGSGLDSFVRIESRRSVEVFGVRIRVMEFPRACRTAELVAAGQTNKHRCSRMDSVFRRTLEAADLLPHEALANVFTDLVGNLFRDILFHEMLLHRLQHGFQVLF